MALTRMARNIGFIRKGNLLSRLDRALSHILEKNLGVKEHETVLIAYDSEHARLAKRFKEISYAKTKLLKLPKMKINGQEPKKRAAQEFLKHDVIIILTQKSLSHTKSRRDATSKGIRIASMPGITEDIIKRSVVTDYVRMKKDTMKLISLFNKSKTVRLETRIGTNLTFSIKGRKGHGSSAGIFSKKGKWGNLPEGEAYIAPVERTANGVFVVDGSVAGFGRMHHPVIVFVKDGFVKKITDGKKPPEIEKALDSVGKNGRNIAEFGIGVNRNAKVTGVVLEDEKAYGTCHIAFGNNIGFGGKVNVPLHIDCVINAPTIYFDDTRVMKDGKFDPNIFK